MNKADEEIIEILKDTFVSSTRLKTPDDLAREKILKMLLGVSILTVVVRVFVGVFGEELPFGYGAALHTPVAMFFTFLFIHINNQSENPSVIMFFLTWGAMMLGLFF